MCSSSNLHLRCRGRLRSPPSPDGMRPGAGVGSGAKQAHGGLEEPWLSHARFPASTGGDAVAAVLLEVAVQVIRAHKSLKAARALIGAQAGVYTHVVLQVVVVSKGSSTLCTQVRLLSCMLPHMNLELVLPEREKNKHGRIRIQRQKLCCTRRSVHTHLNALSAHSQLQVLITRAISRTNT